jgi:hypothetical protein
MMKECFLIWKIFWSAHRRGAGTWALETYFNLRNDGCTPEEAVAEMSDICQMIKVRARWQKTQEPETEESERLKKLRAEARKEWEELP